MRRDVAATRRAPGRHLLRRQGALPAGAPAATGLASSAPTDAAADRARRARRAARPTGPSRDGCADASDVLLRLRPERARGSSAWCPSFGSDEFNDHHFHYGYFLYAAARLRRDDPALVARCAPVIDTLVADIAAPLAASGDPGPAGVRRVRRPLVGLGHVPVRRRQQPGVELRGGHAWNGLALWAEAQRRRAVARARPTWMLATRRPPPRRTGSTPDPSTTASTTRSSPSTGAASATTPPGSAPSRPRCSASS